MAPRNAFLYHFETGFDALCDQTGHLVLTILNGCNKIDDYVTEVLFPFYEEGSTDDIDHMWAMGIIMVYVLCGYPALKGTEDIQCYNNVERLKLDGQTFPPKQWCNLTPEARKHIKECIHFNPEAIIEKCRRRYMEEANEKKCKLKQLANKEKREEEDGNKRNIVHWLHLYEKCWKSPEDLEEYNNYPVPCGAWGRVKQY
eukprot:jgi/Psemu1/13032/gm1.13032_g